MIISINIEDKNLLAQLLSNLGKEKLLEMVEELENEMIENVPAAPAKANDGEMEETPEQQAEQAEAINNEEQSFNGACRYNPEFSCSAPEPENCILCPRYSSGNEF